MAMGAERTTVEGHRWDSVLHVDETYGYPPRHVLVSAGEQRVWLSTRPSDLVGLQNAQVITGIFGPAQMITVDEMKAIVEQGVPPENAPSVAATLAEITREELASLEQLSLPGNEERALKDAALQAPVVRIVNAMLAEAHRKRASDIHLEPTQDSISLRYRIDGILYEQAAPPLSLYPAITSRIKILAGLNIAEKRLPQDGRMRLVLDAAELDVRVATAPSVYGESVALRLLDEKIGLRTLGDLGLSQYDQDRLGQVLRGTDGIILVTGPTGGGKTTTLYALLQTLHTPERKIMTLEDPVEYEIPGITQIHVRPRIGLTFATGLRSLLRHDPDVLLVGEIRDRETAEMAIHASLTGHLVLSSLHTNDAPGALTRLIDMGIEPFLMSATVRAVVAQRLVRVLCSRCRVAKGDRYEAVGCDACEQSGYSGRTAISEVFVCTEDMLSDALVDPTTERLRQIALASGMRSLFQDGMDKVAQGITSMDEVRRVIGYRVDAGVDSSM